MKLRTLLVLLALATALLSHTAPSFSTAAFTSTSSTGKSTIQASPDWTPPTVSMDNPGTTVMGTVNVSATASDVDSEIRSVSIAHRGQNASGWTELCTATKAPYSCSWNTTAGDDGTYSLRAIATDSHGNTATSAVVSTAVANKISVVLASPSQIIRGNTTLTTTLRDAGTTPYRVTVEFAPTGTDRWSAACSNLSAPYTCVANTALLADGEYDLRATATAGGISTHSEILRKIRVDNTAPGITMGNPGSPLNGTHTFTSSPTDSGSGVAEVRLQYAPTGSTAWADLCTVTSAPYSCSSDTKTLTDGSYSFRAVATDRAGNAATSAVIANRVVENTVSTVTMTNPGSTLSGTVTLSSQASSTAGVQSVRIQRATNGSSTWTTVCTVAQSPYSCSWDSRSVTNGQYSFRAVLTDGNGKETISNLVSGAQVSNAALRGLDVQAVNGRGEVSEIDPGDRLIYTFSGQVDLGSIRPGWNGSPTPVTMALRDNLRNDTIDIRSGGTSVGLGSVNLRESYVLPLSSANFDSSMSASTVTIDGVPRTVVTVEVLRQASGLALTMRASAAATMQWTPSGSVTDLYGRPISTEMVTESGPLDRDF